MSKSSLIPSAWIVSVACLPLSVMAQFSVSPLPYASDALEPIIDKTTMEIHHGKHHVAYVNNLNGLAKDAPVLATLSIDEINQTIASYSTAVRNNAGGHYNHEFFWKTLAPEGQGGAPSEKLAQAIMSAFGSMNDFQMQFNKAATGRFGSGWAWLIVNPDKKLMITSTANQDNPLMNLSDVTQGIPVLGLDVWEHAYYLKYQNKRADYVNNWWKLINWNEVNQRYEAAIK